MTGATTFSIMTLNLTTLSITTLSIKSLLMTLSMNGTQHKEPSSDTLD
jgi:hypothetical protein